MDAVSHLNIKVMLQYDTQLLEITIKKGLHNAE